MNNYLCPFCNNVLRISVSQEFKKGKDTVQELRYCCADAACQELGPQKFPRWDFVAWEGRNINYYRAHFSSGSKYYFVQGSSNAWTRLFYDAPNMGALIRAPIVEIPYFAPQEPLAESLETLFRKMMSYIIFT